MVDDGLKRARRGVKGALYFTFGFMAFFAVAGTAAGLAGGTMGWPLALICGVGLVVLGRLYVRIIRAVFDRRYALGAVVAAGGVSLALAVVAGAQSATWGLMPFVWLSVATLGVSRRRAFAIVAGTVVVMTPLVVLAVRNADIPGLPSASGAAMTGPMMIGLVAGTVVAVVFYSALFAWANRLWVWIWRLAEEAHAGREARARLAVAEERLRFARDLHDLVGHRLSAIAVKSEVAVRLSAADVDAAREEMSAVRGLARTALREVREAVSGYRRLDLTTELGAVRGVLQAAGVSCHLHLPYREVPDGVAPVFAWVVREAVTNVLRHSTASRCDIFLRHSDEEAVLEVRNDGVATAPSGDTAGGAGNGLAGLTERMAEIGGTLTARPTGSGEFVLRAVAPLPVTRSRGEARPAERVPAVRSTAPAEPGERAGAEA
ncbi:MAG: sensor histidine kinase [Microbispora sp.]|nr:sensor histidine kinase [Microbispora sp.]